MPKILIVSVKAGAGHLKAAEAVEAAFAKYHPEAEAKNIDLLDYSNELIKYLYGQMYLDVVKLIPELYAYTYRHYGSSRKFIRPRFLIDKLNFNNLFQLVEEFNPDVVVATHFISEAVLENYRRKREEVLTQMALRMGDKAKRIKKPVTTSPLNPHERRIIHLALKEDDRLDTKSRGDGLLKRVVIIPKR